MPLPVRHRIARCLAVKLPPCQLAASPAQAKFAGSTAKRRHRLPSQSASTRPEPARWRPPAAVIRFCVRPEEEGLPADKCDCTLLLDVQQYRNAQLSESSHNVIMVYFINPALPSIINLYVFGSALCVLYTDCAWRCA